MRRPARYKRALPGVIRTALLLVLVALLSACFKPAETRPRIRIWHQKISTERDLFDEAVRRYNAVHPEVIVETLYKENEELRNLFVIAGVAGQGPEIIYGPADNVGVLVTTKTITPLEKVFSSEFFQRFVPQGLIAWKGSTWLAADQIGNHLMLVYNKDQVEKPPSTLTEMVELGKALTKDLNGDGKADLYGLTWNYREPFFFIPFLTGFGGWVMDEQGRPTLDTPETVRAIQFVLDLRDRHQIIPKEGDYNVADMLFKENRTAMIINGPWSWAGYNVPEKAMVAPLPFNSETNRWCEPIVSAKGYSINANIAAEKLPLARDLIDYLTSSELQAQMARELATTPVDKTVLASSVLQENPALAASMEQAKHSRPMPIVPQMRAIWEGMRGPYQLVMNGSITAKEAARLMQREAEKNIADSNL